MEIKNVNQRILTWESRAYGLCEAVIWDGKFSSFRFCKSGSLTGSGIYSSDMNFLIELHKVLGELIEYMGKEKYFSKVFCGIPCTL